MARITQTQSAEILGLQALGWLAGDQDALERFMNASGLDLAGLRAAAAQPETAIAVLDFLLANEPLLLGFCEATETRPEAIHAALRRRDGGTG